MNERQELALQVRELARLTQTEPRSFGDIATYVETLQAMLNSDISPSLSDLTDMVNRICRIYDERGRQPIGYLSRNRYKDTKHIATSLQTAIKKLNSDDGTLYAQQFANATVADHTAPTGQKAKVTAVSGKPRLFIASSTEGDKFARAIQKELERATLPELWSQGTFELSATSIESLEKVANQISYAVIVLTPDDVVQKRDAVGRSPRDNVIFELGLFIGAIGRRRTFLVCPSDEKLDLPTDLIGITVARFSLRDPRSTQAAVGSACTDILNAIDRA